MTRQVAGGVWVVLGQSDSCTVLLLCFLLLLVVILSLGRELSLHHRYGILFSGFPASQPVVFHFYTVQKQVNMQSGIRLVVTLLGVSDRNMTGAPGFWKCSFSWSWYWLHRYVQLVKIQGHLYFVPFSMCDIF
uniref:Uncharacterized protein n=1 Tax=Rousettus aegyptiacus TaxID=9407 RepID=A0A7J8ILZ8_ROUAE|nr:hypothetical protein HJG63_010558 [Rousettus aegyptiacus]